MRGSKLWPFRSLHHYGDLALREIAALLEISQGTVKRSLHEARSALRRRLQAEHQGESTRRTARAAGWIMAGSQPQQYRWEVVLDAYEGDRAARLAFRGGSPRGFGTLMQTIRSDHYRSRRVRLSAAVCTD